MERKVRSGYDGLAQTIVVFPSVPMESAIAVTGSQGELTSMVVPVLNALLLIDGGFCDVKVTEISPEQRENTSPLISITESGMVTEVSL